METNYNPYANFDLKQKEPLPNATAVLVLGILSIVLCWCCYLPPIVMGIIAVVMGAQGRRLYRTSPDKYTQASYSNLNAGYICGVIGLVLTALVIIFAIVNAIVNPGSSTRDLEELQRILR
jgi:M penetrans paralogue family 26